MSETSEKSSIDQLWPYLTDDEKISMMVYDYGGKTNQTICAHCGFQGDKEEHFGVLVHIILKKNGKYSSSAKNSAWLCSKCFAIIPADQLITELKPGKLFTIMFSRKTKILGADGQTVFQDFYFTEETIAKFFPEILRKIRVH